MEQVPVRSAENDSDEDHYLVLSQMIAAVSQDQSQLRALVYEFARRKLRRSLYPQFEDGDWTGIQEQLSALESAIDKVESDAADKGLTFAPEPPLTYSQLMDDRPVAQVRPQRAVTVTSNEGPASPLRMAAADDDVIFAVARIGKRARANLWWKVQLSLAVLLGLIAFAATAGKSTLGLFGYGRPEVSANNDLPKAQDAQVNTALNKRSGPIARASPPSIPLPTEYGAFALSEGRLIELPQLAMRVPDPRVAISPVISTPSQIHFPAGKLEFVIFRRDLANSAPDRVSLRVIAQVMRTLTFDGKGKPTYAKIDDAWVVRSNSYQMRVAPVPDSPEMILIRPDPPELVLPSGRYALVLKGTAYDFSLDGSNTDSAHCLERTDALTAPVYSECHKL
jgi:hypothetical protein